MNKVITLLIVLLTVLACSDTSEEEVQSIADNAVEDALQNQPTPTQTPEPEPTATAEPEPTPIQIPAVTYVLPTPMPTPLPKPTATPLPIPTPQSVVVTAILGVPYTSASAVTSPPNSMEGINTHTEVYGTGADPNVITLGPKIGGHPGWEPYPNKSSMEFELKHGVPVLAPIDMVFIGFKNRSAKYRVNLLPDGQNQVFITPFNDLYLNFESVSPDWPGMIIGVYHLLSSPLLLGHNQNPDCGEVEEWGSNEQIEGHIFYEFREIKTSDLSLKAKAHKKLEKYNALSCDALIGHTVKRGEIIGFAGSTGARPLKERPEGGYITVGTPHSMAPFQFKVSHTSENPTVELGNRYLHWVQPGSFFYWKCYSPDAKFPSGVIAYPFECGGYQLPVEQHDVNFKYSH